MSMPHSIQCIQHTEKYEYGNCPNHHNGAKENPLGKNYW